MCHGGRVPDTMNRFLGCSSPKSHGLKWHISRYRIRSILCHKPNNHCNSSVCRHRNPILHGFGHFWLGVRTQCDVLLSAARFNTVNAGGSPDLFSDGDTANGPLNVSASVRASRLRKIKDKLGKRGKTKKDEANFDQCWNRSRSRSRLASNSQCGAASLSAAQL